MPHGFALGALVSELAILFALLAGQLRFYLVSVAGAAGMIAAFQLLARGSRRPAVHVRGFAIGLIVELPQWQQLAQTRLPNLPSP